MELGKSTEGKTFILAIISSPENLGSLNAIKITRPTLAYSEELSAEEVERLVKEGKAVIAMSMSIHANEVGGAQMAPELVYELITCDSPEDQEDPRRGCPPPGPMREPRWEHNGGGLVQQVAGHRV